MSDLLTPADFEGYLGKWAKYHLIAAGNTEDQVKGHLDALEIPIHDAGREYRVLWDDRNRIARELADLRDDIDTRVKAGVVAALRNAAQHWENRSGDMEFDEHRRQFVAAADEARERARQIEEGEVDL